MHVPDCPAQPPPVAVHVTLSPSAGLLVGVPLFGWVLEAEKVHPPPPAQQLEPTAEVMVQVTDVSATWPSTRNMKEPTAYPEGSGTMSNHVATLQSASVGGGDDGGRVGGEGGEGGEGGRAGGAGGIEAWVP